MLIDILQKDHAMICNINIFYYLLYLDVHEGPMGLSATTYRKKLYEYGLKPGMILSVTSTHSFSVYYLGL